MKRQITALLVSLCVSTASAAVGTYGCSPRAAESAQSREVVVIFGSAVAALEVLDLLHAKHMREAPDPTDEEFAKAQAVSDKLHRLRDALAITREWLSGSNQSEQAGRMALHDAAEVLQLLIDEMRSQDVKIPEQVDAALAALKLLA